jgi:hypothetical protein
MIKSQQKQAFYRPGNLHRNIAAHITEERRMAAAIDGANIAHQPPCRPLRWIKPLQRRAQRLQARVAARAS